MLAAELLLGASFILLALYTSKFKELTVNVSGKSFSTHYGLSGLLLIAGLMVPLDATLMKIGVYDAIARGNMSMELYIHFRLLSQFLLSVAGALALLGMYVFKKAVEDFCFRLGSMSALFEGRKRG